MVPLDSAVNVAFPAITAAFGVPPSGIQWVIVCYVIANATLLLVFGRLGDLFGHAADLRRHARDVLLAYLRGHILTVEKHDVAAEPQFASSRALLIVCCLE